MKRYLIFGSLKDDNKPAYICSVCSRVGFAYEHIAGRPDMHFELCKVCGYDAGSTLNKEKWYKAWKECGSEVLFDKPYEERCEYMDKIQDAYLRFDYYIPTDKNIQEKHISEQAFIQNGFKYEKDSNRTIFVECNRIVSKCPYETNRIIFVKENGPYIAICKKNDLHYLFLSKHFCYNNSVIRSSYLGLTPEVFYISMFIEKICEVEDAAGNNYRIWIE